MLILDEATSDLDGSSETFMQQPLATLMQDRTVIAIVHRLSAIANAWAVMLEDGRVVERRSHDALLEERGKPGEYHSIQFASA